MSGYTVNPDVVCYHNWQGVADYGRLGHSEVVGMNIPVSSFKDFADEYFSLLPNGERTDRGDRGGEYRTLIGLEGGVKSPLYPQLERAAKGIVVLKEGQGNEDDNYGERMVYVYDSNKFPFHRAEVYQQFHDGFMPREYYP